MIKRRPVPKRQRPSPPPEVPEAAKPSPEPPPPIDDVLPDEIRKMIEAAYS
jgi:hypothetical protein